MKSDKIKFIEKGRLDNNEMLSINGGNGSSSCSVQAYIICGVGYKFTPQCMIGYTICEECYHGCIGSSYISCDQNYFGKP